MIINDQHPELVIPGVITALLVYTYYLVIKGFLPKPSGSRRAFWLCRPITISAAGILLAWMSSPWRGKGLDEPDRLYSNGWIMIAVGVALELALLNIQLSAGDADEQRIEAGRVSTLSYIVPCWAIAALIVDKFPRLSLEGGACWTATVATLCLAGLSFAIRRR